MQHEMTIHDELKMMADRFDEARHEDDEETGCVFMRALAHIRGLESKVEHLDSRYADTARLNRLYLFAAPPEVTKEVTKRMGLPGADSSIALGSIARERSRQTRVEGWTPEHDDQHVHGELATAAACYALMTDAYPNAGQPPDLWPSSWAPEWWKPSVYRRDLVKAGALILAELERLDRRNDRGVSSHNREVLGQNNELGAV